MDGNRETNLPSVKSPGFLSILCMLAMLHVLTAQTHAAEPNATLPEFHPSSLDYLHHGILRKDLAILGAQSCAAASCHGGPRPGLVQESVARGNAYPIWLEKDPHAQSWNTFCSPESVAMMNRLEILDVNGEITDPAGYDNCLACHNSTPRCDPRSAKTQTFRREGVGCSGCHGPSQQWIGTHFQDSWCEPSVSQAGYVPMHDYLARARVCASCHIGDQDRDMNHQIIAAGHPPLRYDFATYHHRQPKHWREPAAHRTSTYEAQLWLAGQVAATDASLSLLVRRTNPHDGARWPALSSYDCSSCHHSLGFANQRSPLTDVTNGRSKNAAAIASHWNDSGLRFVLHARRQNGVAQDSDDRLLGQLDQLRTTMESSGTPDAANIHILARQTREALAIWVDDVYRSVSPTFTAADLASLVVAAASRGESYSTWESTVQLYLAAVASRSTWPNSETVLVADRLRTGLRYPDAQNTPEFEKAESGPTLSRSEAAKLAVELAAWLGDAQTPDLNLWEGQQTAGQDDREQLQAVIDRVNQTLREKQTNRERDSKPDDTVTPRAEKSKTDDLPKQAPKPKLKTPQELLEELRKRQSDALNNPFGND